MMKKNFIRMFPLTAFLFGMSSCNSDNGHTEVSKYITVDTSIGSLARTIADGNNIQRFTNGDQISIYAWAGNADAVNTSDLVVNNSINTYNGTTWTAAPQMLWKDQVTAHYFLGVFPAKAITNFATDAYTVDATKTMEQNDLLVAVNSGVNNTGFTATITGIPLQFDHVMAKLIVNLTFRSQWGTTPTVAGVTVHALSNATVNYLTKRATATTNSAADIALQAVTTNTSYQFIMVPQAGIDTRITIKIGEKEYIYTGDVSLESGKFTTVNLIVGREGITLGSVSINPWGEGINITDGEAQE